MKEVKTLKAASVSTKIEPNNAANYLRNGRDLLHTMPDRSQIKFRKETLVDNEEVAILLT